MATDSIERPTFYEGEYLGAADLNTAVEHARIHHARHMIGGHVWGIAVGLDLVETEVPATGGIEVHLEPGYAWDGFGRPIVVLAHCRLPESGFSDITCPAGSGVGGCRVNVWLRYHEESTAGPRPGFEQCNGDADYGRVRETFQIEIGDRAANRQRDNITVEGQSVRAEDALQAFDSNRPLLLDTSVPFQELPVPATETWLIPLGFVRWRPGANPGESGQFVARSDDEKDESRRQRRFIGIVGEGLYAAHTSLRVRRRDADPEPDWSDDLFWVEGDARLQGDTHIWGKKLSFLDDHGGDDGVPLHIQRGGAAGARMLEVATGPETDTTHGLAIGPASTANPDAIIPKVVVKSSGRVGIGTTIPSEPLHVHGDGGTLTKVLIDNPSGAANAGSKLVIQESAAAAGEVGFFNSGNAANKDLAPGTTFLAALSGAAALSLNHQGQGPITFNTDDWTERMRITRQGQVGIGTKIPDARLHVEGGDILVTGADIRWGRSRLSPDQGGSIELGGDSTTAGTGIPYIDFHFGPRPAEDFNTRIINEGDGLLSIYASRFSVTGLVGIGTTAPAGKLDVRGNIRLGMFGQLFAIGGVENLRVVRGTVESNGAIIEGSGFTVNPYQTGFYRITFNSAFQGPPSVVVTQIFGAFGVGGNTLDNAVLTGTITNAEFEVKLGDSNGAPSNRRFSFIAIGGFL